MNLFTFLNDYFRKKDRINTKEKTSKAKAEIICPRCGNSSMEYDGLLDMRCKMCGFLHAGSHT